MILAGYTKEMQLFLSANSGLASRFPNQIEFPDYTGAELYKILCSIARIQGYTLDAACELPLVTYLTASRPRTPPRTQRTHGPQHAGKGHSEPVQAACCRPGRKPGAAGSWGF